MSPFANEETHRLAMAANREMSEREAERQRILSKPPGSTSALPSSVRGDPFGRRGGTQKSPFRKTS